MKAHYRHTYVQKIFSNLDTIKPVLKLSSLGVMKMVVAAWGKVTEATVVNCFKKAGVIKVSQGETVHDENHPFKDLQVEIEKLCERSQS